MDREKQKKCKQSIAESILEGKIKCIKCKSNAYCFFTKNRFLESFCRDCEYDISDIDDIKYMEHICQYCNLVATKKVYTQINRKYFICDKCANNIRSDIRLCNDSECIFPFIHDMDSMIFCHHTCQVCLRYWNHLKNFCRFKPHFVNIDFCRSKPDFKDKFYCGLAATVQKYLKEKSQI